MKIRIFNSQKKFINESVDFIKTLCTSKEHKNSGKNFSIALSGGSTPAPIYKDLARENFSFERIIFYQVDERYVEPTHPDSNQKMIRESLNGHKENINGSMKDKSINIHFFDTTLPINESLSEYEKIIKKLPNQSFDLVILGIGPDGHFASIFPESPLLKATGKDQLVGHTQTNTFAVKDRLTLALKPILKSKNILVLLKGKEKQEIITELQNKSAKSPKDILKSPAFALIKHPNLTVFFCETD